MMFINILLFSISSTLMIYNISFIVSQITNSSLKFRLTPTVILYICCSVNFIISNINISKEYLVYPFSFVVFYGTLILNVL